MDFAMIARAVALLIATMAVGAAHGSEQAERQAIWDETRQAFLAGDFAQLDHWAETYRARQLRTGSGQWRLTVFYAAFNYPRYLYGEFTEQTFERMERDVSRWIAERPDSATAGIVLAMTMLNRAWFLRGYETADTVTPAGWQGYLTHNRRANEQLESIRQARDDDPQWFVTAIKVVAGEGNRLGDWRTIADAGLAAHPRHYDIHAEIVRHNLPQWHGNRERLEQAAQRVANIKGGEGDMAYARAYWTAADQHYRHELFFGTDADWPRMKSGFEQIVTNYPTAWNRNAFARFACSAQDKATTRKLLEELNENIVLDLWDDKQMPTWCAEWSSSN